jgi:hypothetical protein
MKPTLQLKLSQHLTLTPQLQQSIRLLQLSTLELNAEVERMLQENPLLEKDGEDDEGAAARVRRVDDDRHRVRRAGRDRARRRARRRPRRRALRHRRGRRARRPATEVDFAEEGGGGGDGDWGSAPASDDDEFYPQQVATSTLRDHLVAQLGMLSLPQRDRQLVTALIDALDEDGFLTSSLEEIAELIPEELDIGVEDLAIALKYLQSFEPVGVGARNIGESLALQLRALPDDTPCRAAASRSSRTPRPPREPRRHAPAPPAAVRRRDGPLDPRPHPHAQPAPWRGVCKDRGELRRARRGRKEDEGALVRVAQRGGHAEAARQPDLRRHPGAEPRRVEPAARRATAGSQVADPQRAAAVRDDPARRAGDRRPPAALLRARRRSRCGRWCCARSPTCSACTSRRSRG